jgi:DNA-binding response OmpR family regulator
LKILAVDDSVDITDALEMSFEMIGYDFTTSNSGKEAVSLIMKNAYDVILLDFAMPGFSGLDVIRELESMTNVPDLNIIMFTASAIEPSEINQLNEKGIKGIIRKPIHVNELEKEINKILSKE